LLKNKRTKDIWYYFFVSFKTFFIFIVKMICKGVIIITFYSIGNKIGCRTPKNNDKNYTNIIVYPDSNFCY